jgi:hypothetical protein
VRRLTTLAATCLLLALTGCSSAAAPISSRTLAVAQTPSPTSTPLSTAQVSLIQTPTAEPTPLESQWIPLASQSPSDIIAAAKQSNIYQMNASGQGDVVPVSHLGTPVFVLGLSPSYSSLIPSYYEIPLLDDAGTVIGALDCELNTNQTAISVVDSVQYGQPRSSGSVAQITMQQAFAEIATQHHVSPKTGTQPQLIYFAFNLSAEETGQINWKGGGNFADNPIWEFVGTDGNQQFAGDDGHAYYWDELPLAQSKG